MRLQKLAVNLEDFFDAVLVFGVHPDYSRPMLLFHLINLNKIDILKHFFTNVLEPQSLLPLKTLRCTCEHRFHTLILETFIGIFAVQLDKSTNFTAF